MIKKLIPFAIASSMFLLPSCNQKTDKDKKQQTLSTVEEIPLIGHEFQVDFGEYLFNLNFKTDTEMTFTSLRGENKGYTETVKYSKTEISKNLYMFTWQEKSKTTVTHVDNLATGEAHTNITSPKNEFTNLKGTIKLVK